MARLIAHSPQRAALKSSGFYPEPSGTMDITENGLYNVKKFEYADVALPMQRKAVGSSLTQQIIRPDIGYVGLSEVIVGDARKDVNFYDDDGTLLYSYSKSEFLTLNTMPTLPMKSELICQGWNWTRQDAVNYVNDYGMLDIGATYITNDGKTRLYLTIPDADLLQPTLYVQVSDGELTATVNGLNPISVSNSGSNYSNKSIDLTLPPAENYPANYRIELSYAGSGGYKIGNNSTSSKIFGVSSAYNNCLTRAEIGSNCNFTGSAFYQCDSIGSITIPVGVTAIMTNNFYLCTSLKCVILPTGLESIGNSAFFCCASMKIVSLPKSVTGTLGSYIFQNCALLEGLAIPDGVTSLGSYLLQGCQFIKKIVVPASVQSISSNTFYSCVSLREIVLAGRITSIASSSFYACTGLREIIIPNSVRSIGASAFQNCGQLGIVDLSLFSNPSSVPTLTNTGVFSSIPADGVFLVKNAEMLAAFTAASNWSSFSSRYRIKT